MIPLQILFVISAASLSAPVTSMTGDPSFYNQPLLNARDSSLLSQRRNNNFLGQMAYRPDNNAFMRTPYQSMDTDRNGRLLRYRNRGQSYNYPTGRRNAYSQYDDEGKDHYYKVQSHINDRDYTPYNSDGRYPGSNRGYSSSRDMSGLRRQQGSRLGYQDDSTMLMNLR